MSEDTKETLDVSQAISILAAEIKQQKEQLHQLQTANTPAPPQDAFNSPITLKTLLAELPNLVQMAKQTGLIKPDNPQDPLLNYKLAIGEKALERVFEDLNKTLFNKSEIRGVKDVMNNTGVQ